MSRRVSLALKDPNVKLKPRVKFPDELVFLDNIKENNIAEVRCMLRRASATIDLNKINDSGLTVLHQAVLNNSFEVVKLLLENQAKIDAVDEENWTSLHAAAFMNYYEICEYLLDAGSNAVARTLENERPIDLVDATNLPLISLFLNHMKAKNPNFEFKELNYKKISSLFKEMDLNDQLKDNIKDLVENDLEVLESKDFIRTLTIGFLDSCQTDDVFEDDQFNLKCSVLKYFVSKNNRITCSSTLLDSIIKFNIPNESIEILKENRLITKESYLVWKEKEEQDTESEFGSQDKSTMEFLDELFDVLEH